MAKRTNYCGELTEKNIGEKVVLKGWVAKHRDLGGISFIDLRDRTGIVQIVSGDESLKLGREYVIEAIGTVRKREENTINENIATGKIEINAETVNIISKAETPPFEIGNVDTNEMIRLKHRYLDLRSDDMQNNLKTRYKITKVARDYFDENGFMEIETPMLTKSTPEGARDYLVPSRVHAGAFYALPQSPQLYKQILMISGMDRYIQIARCFRDEDLRADRQPEFTQIDLEMSFVEAEDVMEVNEGFIKRMMKDVLGKDVRTPFVRLTYAQSMDRFGSDKPDTRFAMELIDVSDIAKGCGFSVFASAIAGGGSVRAINAKNAVDKLSRRDMDALTDFAKIYRAKGMAWIKVEEGNLNSPITKFLSEEETKKILDRTKAEVGDVLMFIADNDEVVFDALGNLRLEVAKRLDLIDKSLFNFLWVTEFPLLEYDHEEKRYVAKHHPFTSPMDEDLKLLDTDPGKVRAKAYDIVLNGNEIGGGSIRIHSTELQEKMLKLLGFSEEQAWARFGFLLEAFKYGTPPHGGLAYGLDRLAMLLTGAESIREVIAFPKIQTASEVMSGAPDIVDDKQLKEIHVKVIDSE